MFSRHDTCHSISEASTVSVLMSAPQTNFCIEAVPQYAENFQLFLHSSSERQIFLAYQRYAGSVTHYLVVQDNQV